jgi:hypothetical protein
MVSCLAAASVFALLETGRPLGCKPSRARANYFLTGLLFKGTVDARYKFEFGPLNSQCRKLDASTMN